MTMKREGWQRADAGVELEVLARIGGCRVVRLRDGRRVIRGGDVLEQGAVREWASMFCHEAFLDTEREAIGAGGQRQARGLGPIGGGDLGTAARLGGLT
jgi:hypothetical protein